MVGDGGEDAAWCYSGNVGVDGGGVKMFVVSVMAVMWLYWWRWGEGIMVMWLSW